MRFYIDDTDPGIPLLLHDTVENQCQWLGSDDDALHNGWTSSKDEWWPPRGRNLNQYRKASRLEVTLLFPQAEYE